MADNKKTSPKKAKKKKTSKKMAEKGNTSTSENAVADINKMKEIFAPEWHGTADNSEKKKLMAGETDSSPEDKGKMKAVDDQSTEDAASCTGGPEGAPKGGSEVYYPIDRFLNDIGASKVVESFEEALQSGNIEGFGHQLESEAFPGIIVMLSVTHHIDKDPVLLLKFLKKYVMGSKCDVVDFNKEFGLGEAQRLPLLHALFNVMAVYQLAGEVDEPAEMVAEAIVTGYESGVWDGVRIVRVLSYLLLSKEEGIKIIGLVMITALANLCKERTMSETFYKVVIDESGVADSVIGMSLSLVDFQKHDKSGVADLRKPGKSGTSDLRKHDKSGTSDLRDDLERRVKLCSEAVGLKDRIWNKSYDDSSCTNQ